MKQPKPKSETKPQTGAMTKEDYVRLASFRFALRRFLAFSQANAKKHGLTPQQHQVLLSIRSFPDRDTITIGELAHHLCIKHHSAVELVDRLTGLGMVVREPSPDDRRSVLISLTTAAEMALASLSANNLEEIRRLKPFLQT
jgi:DNA-binding MarR family transcriptional regulator